MKRQKYLVLPAKYLAFGTLVKLAASMLRGVDERSVFLTEVAYYAFIHV